ncbi:hypothetical protein LN042_35105, partial [Kitasatospora sp. RB6PN24]|nr:hypothetical protein [Kitasatospora humi]
MADDADDQAVRLYGLPPNRFIPERDRAVRAARAAGRREDATRLASLRRPTQAAWAVNQLARHHADQLARLLDLGAAMRSAQSRRDTEALRELAGQRHRLLEE